MGTCLSPGKSKSWNISASQLWSPRSSRGTLQLRRPRCSWACQQHLGVGTTCCREPSRGTGRGLEPEKSPHNNGKRPSVPLGSGTYQQPAAGSTEGRRAAPAAPASARRRRPRCLPRQGRGQRARPGRPRCPGERPGTARGVPVPARKVPMPFMKA